MDLKNVFEIGLGVLTALLLMKVVETFVWKSEFEDDLDELIDDDEVDDFETASDSLERGYIKVKHAA